MCTAVPFDNCVMLDIGSGVVLGNPDEHVSWVVQVNSLTHNKFQEPK